MGLVLSENDIEELELAKELCRGVSVNGEEIVCFVVLSDLISSRKDIHSLSDDTLLLVYKQLGDYNRFWGDFEWFDNRKLEEVVPKIRALLKAELSQRKDPRTT